MKFYIETYGCTSNFGNSQDAAEALVRMGHSMSSLEESDAVIVNTCCVTQKTERKILARLRQLQGERLVVAGCLSSALPESISRIISREQVGLLNESAAKRIADLFSDLCLKNPRDDLNNPIFNFPIDRKHICGIVNISEGCNGSCSYCIVRKARGRLISRAPEDILDAVHEQVRSGIAEIQIASQDTAAWGQDLGATLPDLLEKITDIPGNFMLRLGMMNPDNIIPIQQELIQTFRSPKVYRFLHIPVQSGSDKILKSMGRRYCAQDFSEIIGRFRSSYPDITIITDAIVGFPGETEDDFRATMDIIEKLQPDKVNITRFSRRPGTAAAELYDMPDRIKKDRSRELTRLWLGIAAKRNRSYEGEVLRVRVTEQGREGTMKARAKNYLGVVLQGTPKLGESILVKITASNSYFAIANASSQ